MLSQGKLRPLRCTAGSCTHWFPTATVGTWSRERVSSASIPHTVSGVSSQFLVRQKFKELKISKRTGKKKKSGSMSRLLCRCFSGSLESFISTKKAFLLSPHHRNCRLSKLFVFVLFYFMWSIPFCFPSVPVYQGGFTRKGFMYKPAQCTKMSVGHADM